MMCERANWRLKQYANYICICKNVRYGKSTADECPNSRQTKHCTSWTVGILVRMSK